MKGGGGVGWEVRDLKEWANNSKRATPHILSSILSFVQWIVHLLIEFRESK